MKSQNESDRKIFVEKYSKYSQSPNPFKKKNSESNILVQKLNFNETIAQTHKIQKSFVDQFPNSGAGLAQDFKIPVFNLSKMSVKSRNFLQPYNSNMPQIVLDLNIQNMDLNSVLEKENEVRKSIDTSYLEVPSQRSQIQRRKSVLMNR